MNLSSIAVTKANDIAASETFTPSALSLRGAGASAAVEAGHALNANALTLAFSACARTAKGGGRAKRRRAPPPPQNVADVESLDQDTRLHEHLSSETPAFKGIESQNSFFSKQQVSRQIAIINRASINDVEITPESFVRFDISGTGGSVLLPRSAKPQRHKRSRVRVQLASSADVGKCGALSLGALLDDGDEDGNMVHFDLQTLLYLVAAQRRTRGPEPPLRRSIHQTSDALTAIPDIERPYIDDEPIVIRRYCALPCNAKDDVELRDRCYCWHLARYVAMIS
jgi:hypothetical protein